ncbi:MAG: DNA polymerase III subunit delta' [Gammaproteobacteria bacterium]|nr:MAG: DNA polymerase III subunit delta' [Gammaproteobacteria bacterium]
MLYPWQTAQWQSFSLQKELQRIPHAICLTGTVGVGKSDFASHMIASILCQQTQAEACGRCHSCQLFAAGNHPDHTWLEPEEEGKQIKIEQIRKLKSKQELTPTVSKWKTVVINPADKMNINASNSLLKLLEEPQENTLLILITAKADRLPITILSRCQHMIIPTPDKAVATHWLQEKGCEVEKIPSLLTLAKGGPLRALSLLETDVLEQVDQLSQDFDLLLRRQANPVELAKRWQQYDLLMSFNFLQNNIKDRLQALQLKPNDKLAKRYWYIYDCILSAIKLTSSSNNVNKILLIEQFMVSVMDKNWNNSGIVH